MSIRLCVPGAPLLGSLFVLLVTSCTPTHTDSSLKGLHRLEPPPVELRTARDFSSWVEVNGDSFWKSKSRPRPLWDIDGDGTDDFFVRRPSMDGKGGVVEVVSAARGETLRSYDSESGEWVSIQPLHDVDGDGAADYLLSIVRRKAGAAASEPFAGLRTISGRSGADLAVRSWSDFQARPRMLGYFEEVDSVVAAPARRSIVIAAKTPEGEKQPLILLNPSTLEPRCFMSWYPPPRRRGEHALWMDWGQDGISERVFFGRGGIRVCSSLDGSVIHETPLRSGPRVRRRDRSRRKPGETSQVWGWETRPSHVTVVGSQLVFDGPSDGQIGSALVSNGHFGFRHWIDGPQIPFLHGFVPVRDANGDGVTDLYSFCRRWDPQLGGMLHEFLLFSGRSGEQLDF